MTLMHNIGSTLKDWVYRLQQAHEAVQQLFALRSFHFEKAQPARLAGSLSGIIVDNPKPPGQIVWLHGEPLTRLPWFADMSKIKNR